MNDQRPTRWPCSADSSRNAGWPGSRARSLRKALTGVSVSAMKVWRSGTSACSAASRLTVSRSGATGMASAATAIEHLLRVGEDAPARVQQRRQMEEDVGRLLVEAVAGLVARRPRALLGLPLDLGGGHAQVVEERDDVGAVGTLLGARGDRALE